MAVASPPGAPEQKKKGLSPLAWILIGCGGLILVVGILVVAGVGFVGYKAKQFATDLEKNPVTIAGKAYAALHPDVEFVSADEESREITFRDVKTGEITTINADDIRDGRITIKNDQGEVTFDAKGGADGGLTMTDETGKTVFQAGAGSAEDLPSWIPVYPGAEITATYVASAAGQGSGGSFSLTTSDGVDTVYEHYRSALEDAGFEIQTTGSTGQGKILIATQADPARQVTVSVSEVDGKTQATVQYSAQ